MRFGFFFFTALLPKRGAMPDYHVFGRIHQSPFLGREALTKDWERPIQPPGDRPLIA